MNCNNVKQNIENVLNTPQLASMATVTPDGKPWVRYVMIATDPDGIIRCATFVDARKVAQIKQNPEVHITCGINDPAELKPYLQIQANAVLTTDDKVRHDFWNPPLANIFDSPDDPKYGVIEMTPYRIEYWAPGRYEPEVWLTDDKS